MRSEPMKQARRKKAEAGNTILEFALVMTFLVPMFAGAFTIGMALTKAIQVSNVAFDAVVLLVRSTTDPNSGLDLSQTQNQRIIVQAAAGLGMNSDAQDDPSSTGSAAVILSKVAMVGPTECSVGGMTPNSTTPFWTSSNCPNYGSYVFEYRVVIGNGTRWSSTLGNPGGTVQSNGTITAVDIASNSSDRATNFAAVTGMTLSSSTFALISEMYADVSYLNFFSVMPNPVIYARSIS
jgi:Flp pilus assembly protein TadG